LIGAAILPLVPVAVHAAPTQHRTAPEVPASTAAAATVLYGPAPSLDQVRAGSAIEKNQAGDSPREIQDRLSAIGFPTKSTGIYDLATQKSVNRLQNALGVPMTPKFDAKALETLEQAEQAPFLQQRTTGIAWHDGHRLGKVSLAYIDQHPVEIGTAFVVTRMKADALRDGVHLSVISGFRSHAKQAALYEAYRAGHGNDAAPPGFSRHEDGVAIDWNADSLSSPQYQWLHHHAASYGFERTVPGEPWHWEYRPDIP
jgi:hypothetical protein